MRLKKTAEKTSQEFIAVCTKAVKLTYSPTEKFKLQLIKYIPAFAAITLTLIVDIYMGVFGFSIYNIVLISIGGSIFGFIVNRVFPVKQQTFYKKFKEEIHSHAWTRILKRLQVLVSPANILYDKVISRLQSEFDKQYFEG
jgi:hypothetical protein